MQTETTEDPFELLVDQAIRTIERVMDASIVLTQCEATIRALIAKATEMRGTAEQEAVKPDTLKVWRQMADFISAAVQTLDGRPHNSQVEKPGQLEI